MPLDFQNTPVLFTGGIDKNDQYLVSSRKTTTLNNCVFDTAQTVMLRNGQYLLSLAPAVPTIPSPLARTNPSFTGAPYRMAQNQGTLLLEGVNGLFSREAYESEAVNPDAPTMLQVRADASPTGEGGRPDFVRAAVETDYVGTVRDGAEFNSHDFGRIENYDGNGRVCTLWAWVEAADAAGNHQLHVRAFDEGISDNTTLPVARTQILDQVFPYNAVSFIPGWVRVAASSTDFYVLIYDGATGFLKIPFRFAPGTATASFPTYSVSTGPAFDVLVDPTDGQLVVAHDNGASNTLRIAKLNAAVTAESFGNSFVVTGSPNSISLVLTRISGVYRYTALYYCSATRTTIRGVVLTAAAGTVTETTIYVHGVEVGRITGVDTGDNVSSTFAVFFDSNPGTVAISPYQLVAQLQVNKTTLATTLYGSIAENMNVHGRPVVQDNTILLPCSYLLDELYPSIFVVKASVDISTTYYPAYVLNQVTGITAARVHWGAAGNLARDWDRYAPVLHSYLDTNTGDMIFPADRWGAQAVSVRGSITSPTQIWQARLSLTTQDIGYVESGQNTLLAGSCPQSYDGSFFEETGFNHRPVIVSAVASGAGNLSTGTYTVYATYVHVDQRGNISESMPSEPVTFSATNPDGYTATVLAYGLTAKRNVTIRLYRTIANGSVAYLDTATANAYSNGAADADITANNRLPTDGGVLPTHPMPACRVATEHQNRVWCAGGEAGDTIYFSQPISQNIAPEFSRLLVRRVPPTAGRVVNIVSLDDKLVIFCERRIGFIYGDGPTRTGAQDGYSEFVEAVSGYAIPWEQPHSIIRSADGVWFRCGFGLRLLGRNMAVVADGGSDLGSELDAYVGTRPITRALIGTTGQQVRFYIGSQGLVLLFDLIFRQWSTFDNFACVDCTAIGNDFYHLNDTPQLLVTTPNIAPTDNGTPVVASLETAWLAFAGFQAYMRVSRIAVLGQNDSEGVAGTYNITVATQYNYINNGGDYASLYSGDFLRSGDADSPSHQIEMQPAIQKCESIRLKFTFQSSTPSVNSRLRITGINLRTAIKKGRYKMPTANKV